jgi:hypothetical protein
MKNMTFDDFSRLILTAWPDATIEENIYNEIVVYTNHTLNEHGDVVRIVPHEPF